MKLVLSVLILSLFVFSCTPVKRSGNSRTAKVEMIEVKKENGRSV